MLSFACSAKGPVWTAKYYPGSKMVSKKIFLALKPTKTTTSQKVARVKYNQKPRIRTPSAERFPKEAAEAARDAKNESALGVFWVGMARVWFFLVMLVTCFFVGVFRIVFVLSVVFPPDCLGLAGAFSLLA